MKTWTFVSIALGLATLAASWLVAGRLEGNREPRAGRADGAGPLAAEAAAPSAAHDSPSQAVSPGVTVGSAEVAEAPLFEVDGSTLVPLLRPPAEADASAPWAPDQALQYRPFSRALPVRPKTRSIEP